MPITLQELADAFSRIKSTMTPDEVIAEQRKIIEEISKELNTAECSLVLAKAALIRLNVDLVLKTDTLYFGPYTDDGEVPDFVRVKACTIKGQPDVAFLDDDDRP